MTRVTFLLVFAGLSAASPVFAQQHYRVQDEGGFGLTGRFVEFADRYSWETYKVTFDFSVDMAARALAKGSTLDIEVTRRDGSRWSYRCVAPRPGSSKSDMWANVNQLYGRGLSVLTECRVPPKKFAKAVELDSKLVGDPTFVFHVTVQDGKPAVGVQKGFYFLSANEIPGGPLAPYATASDDPSQLGVLFSTKESPEASLPLEGPSVALGPRASR